MRCRGSSVWPTILDGKGLTLLAPVRFIWNATRGHRLAPWRSEYLRWRIETFSGKRAETLRTRDVLAFLWNSRWELLSFLVWTGQVDREARRRV
jgi:hypothetical protein